MIYTNVEVHHEPRQISKTEITAKIVKDVFIEGIGGEGGVWVKMVVTMVGRRRKMRKILKLRWVKCSKTVPKKQNLDQQKMIKNLIFGVYLLISDFLLNSLKTNKN